MHCDSLAPDQTPFDPGDAQAAVDAGRLKDAVPAAPPARAPATAHGWTSQSSAVPLDLRQDHRHPRLHPAHRAQGPAVPAPVSALPPASAASVAQPGRHSSPALDPSDDRSYSPAALLPALNRIPAGTPGAAAAVDVAAGAQLRSHGSPSKTQYGAYCDHRPVDDSVAVAGTGSPLAQVSVLAHQIRWQ